MTQTDTNRSGSTDLPRKTASTSGPSTADAGAGAGARRPASAGSTSTASGSPLVQQPKIVVEIPLPRLGSRHPMGPLRRPATGAVPQPPPAPPGLNSAGSSSGSLRAPLPPRPASARSDTENDSGHTRPQHKPRLGPASRRTAVVIDSSDSSDGELAASSAALKPGRDQDNDAVDRLPDLAASQPLPTSHSAPAHARPEGPPPGTESSSASASRTDPLSPPRYKRPSTGFPPPTPSLHTALPEHRAASTRSPLPPPQPSPPSVAMRVDSTDLSSGSEAADAIATQSPPTQPATPSAAATAAALAADPKLKSRDRYQKQVEHFRIKSDDDLIHKLNTLNFKLGKNNIPTSTEARMAYQEIKRRGLLDAVKEAMDRARLRTNDDTAVNDTSRVRSASPAGAGSRGSSPSGVPRIHKLPVSASITQHAGKGDGEAPESKQSLPKTLTVGKQGMPSDTVAVPFQHSSASSHAERPTNGKTKRKLFETVSDDEDELDNESTRRPKSPRAAEDDDDDDDDIVLVRDTAQRVLIPQPPAVTAPRTQPPALQNELAAKTQTGVVPPTSATRVASQGPGAVTVSNQFQSVVQQPPPGLAQGGGRAAAPDVAQQRRAKKRKTEAAPPPPRALLSAPSHHHQQSASGQLLSANLSTDSVSQLISQHRHGQQHIHPQVRQLHQQQAPSSGAVPPPAPSTLAAHYTQQQQQVRVPPPLLPRNQVIASQSDQDIAFNDLQLQAQRHAHLQAQIHPHLQQAVQDHHMQQHMGVPSTLGSAHSQLAQQQVELHFRQRQGVPQSAQQYLQEQAAKHPRMLEEYEQQRRERQVQHRQQHLPMGQQHQMQLQAQQQHGPPYVPTSHHKHVAHAAIPSTAATPPGIPAPLPPGVAAVRQGPVSPTSASFGFAPTAVAGISTYAPPPQAASAAIMSATGPASLPPPGYPPYGTVQQAAPPAQGHQRARASKSHKPQPSTTPPTLSTLLTPPHEQLTQTVVPPPKPPTSRSTQAEHRRFLVETRDALEARFQEFAHHVSVHLDLVTFVCEKQVEAVRGEVRALRAAVREMQSAAGVGTDLGQEAVGPHEFPYKTMVDVEMAKLLRRFKYDVFRMLVGEEEAEEPAAQPTVAPAVPEGKGSGHTQQGAVQEREGPRSASPSRAHHPVAQDARVPAVDKPMTEFDASVDDKLAGNDKGPDMDTLVEPSNDTVPSPAVVQLDSPAKALPVCPKGVASPSPCQVADAQVMDLEAELDALTPGVMAPPMPANDKATNLRSNDKATNLRSELLEQEQPAVPSLDDPMDLIDLSPDLDPNPLVRDTDKPTDRHEPDQEDAMDVDPTPAPVPGHDPLITQRSEAMAHSSPGQPRPTLGSSPLRLPTSSSSTPLGASPSPSKRTPSKPNPSNLPSSPHIADSPGSPSKRVLVPSSVSPIQLRLSPQLPPAVLTSTVPDEPRSALTITTATPAKRETKVSPSANMPVIRSPSLDTPMLKLTEFVSSFASNSLTSGFSFGFASSIFGADATSEGPDAGAGSASGDNAQKESERKDDPGEQL